MKHMKKLKTTLFLLLTILLQQSLYAQQIEDRIDNVPYKLSVYNSPENYTVKGDQVIISAKGKTNLFNNPNGQSKVNNAPMILFEPKGDFTLSAHVTGDLEAVYDVAALVVYQDENIWGKLCYENSVSKQPTIVSVVTRTYSDDCNSMTVGKSAYLSVVKKGKEFSFFYSKDGLEWNMIRSFRLNVDDNVKVGFASHGSRGNGFTGKFSQIKFQEKAIDDMRNF